MKKQIIALALVLFTVLPASALAEAGDTNARIAELQAQIAILQAKIKEIQASGSQVNNYIPERSVYTSSPSSEKWCHTFDKNIGKGYKGSEVSALVRALAYEQILDRQWVSEADTRTEFDNSIADAVSKFQEKYIANILRSAGLTHGTGYVGLSTRIALNKLYGCGSVVGGSTKVVNPTSMVTLDFAGNGQTGTITIPQNGTVTLNWNATNATSCVASNAWLGERGTTGTVTFQITNTLPRTYTLTCASSAGQATASVKVTIDQNTGGAVAVRLSPLTPIEGLIPANSVDANVLVLNLAATSEALALKTLSLQFDGTDISSIRKVTLWDGATKIGETYLVGTSKLLTFYLATPVVIPKYGEKNLIVKADIGDTPGAIVKFSYDGDGNNTATGMESGITVKLPTQDVSGYPLTVSSTIGGVKYKSAPNFAKVNLSNDVLISGSDVPVLRFKITAGNTGDVSIHKLSFGVKQSNVTASDFNLYAYTDSAYSQSASGLNIDGAFLRNKINPSSSGELGIYAENTVGGRTLLVVPPGSTYYFELRAKISNQASNASLNTSLLVDTGAALNGALGTAAQVDASSYNKTIWSPNTRTISSLTEADWTNAFQIPSIIGIYQGLVGGTITSESCRLLPSGTTVGRGDAACPLFAAAKMTAETSGGPHFTDVPTNDPNYKYVETLYSKGIIGGCSTGYFCPGSSLSRGAAVVFVVKAKGYTLVNPATPRFIDVPTSHIFYKYIETAAANGLVVGYNGKFMPDDPISPSDYLAVIAKAFPK